ncbi:SusD/RagB family nutrient-binding outer membrane lipoprotein [Pontibacter saemangeumensis]|uniref:SusD/RagB family nutrient-binding outer membrane lipoprotein n=1 Tax=Pontibacter saemangeumensis TaxID=1084525 RepID=A0ABP8LBI1_9BACT
MKLYNKLLFGAALLTTVSCTEDFEEMNVSPNQPANATSAQLLATAQYNFADNIGDEWNNGRMGMYYAQYWSSTQYTDESRYQIREGVNQTMWNTFYADVLRELVAAQAIEAENQVVGYENRIAIAEIFKVLTYHYLTDIYGGPIPYSEALNDEIATPKYDTGEEVYLGLLSTLDAQVAILDEANPGFGNGDLVYGGDVAMWKKFANSLRLRIALRMIDANPGAATEAIAKSLDPSNGGLISSNAESALFRWIPGAPNNNPLAEAFKTRIDFSMSEPFVEYLQKYDDPRLMVYADPLLGTTDSYVGEVYGLEAGDGNSNGDPKVVSLPSDYAIGETAPTVILDYAEVEFMLAEIAARGIAGVDGTAEEHYNAGIEASFEAAGLSDAQYQAYLAEVPYVGGDLETAKDAIGSQKWIAMYGQGIQAWLERLRLDFEDPYTGEEIFVAPAGGSVDPDVTLVPFRMSYPVTEASLNESNYNAAVQAVGGTNSLGAKPWWDVD